MFIIVGLHTAGAQRGQAGLPDFKSSPGRLGRHNRRPERARRASSEAALPRRSVRVGGVWL